MANNIRSLRKAAQLTQRELAALLGITQGAVSQWELGATYPRTEDLPKLAAALGCTIEDLVERKEQ